MNEHRKIANWLLFDLKNEKRKQHDEQHFRHLKIKNGRNGSFNSSNLSKAGAMTIKTMRKNNKRLRRLIEEDESELTRSPVSGTYIIKDWSSVNKKSSATTTTTKTMSFSKSEVALNSIAASFVEITPQSRARLERIPNRIGPFECKLCKVVYKDAFELAMHNCPRVVHIEYRWGYHFKFFCELLS